jgi:hypothetical protein
MAYVQIYARIASTQLLVYMHPKSVYKKQSMVGYKTYVHSFWSKTQFFNTCAVARAEPVIHRPTVIPLDMYSLRWRTMMDDEADVCTASHQHQVFVHDFSQLKLSETCKLGARCLWYKDWWPNSRWPTIALDKFPNLLQQQFSFSNFIFINHAAYSRVSWPACLNGLRKEVHSLR